MEKRHDSRPHLKEPSEWESLVHGTVMQLVLGCILRGMQPLKQITKAGGESASSVRKISLGEARSMKLGVRLVNWREKIKRKVECYQCNSNRKAKDRYYIFDVFYRFNIGRREMILYFSKVASSWLLGVLCLLIPGDRKGQ